MRATYLVEAGHGDQWQTVNDTRRRNNASCVVHVYYVDSTADSRYGNRRRHLLCMSRHVFRGLLDRGGGNYFTCHSKTDAAAGLCIRCLAIYGGQLSVRHSVEHGYVHNWTCAPELA